MSWITANGKAACNQCRRVPPKGETVYHGLHTPAIWCQACAEGRGFPGLQQEPPSATAPVMAILRALAEKYRLPVPTSWHETVSERFYERDPN